MVINITELTRSTVKKTGERYEMRFKDKRTGEDKVIPYELVKMKHTDGVWYYAKDTNGWTKSLVAGMTTEDLIVEPQEYNDMVFNWVKKPNATALLDKRITELEIIVKQLQQAIGAKPVSGTAIPVAQSTTGTKAPEVEEVDDLDDLPV